MDGTVNHPLDVAEQFYWMLCVDTSLVYKHTNIDVLTLVFGPPSEITMTRLHFFVLIVHFNNHQLYDSLQYE